MSFKEFLESNDKQTSEDIASLASDVMNDDNATADEKSLAGSALSQSNTSKGTTGDVASLASEILRNPNSSPKGKKLAGSVLSQS